MTGIRQGQRSPTTGEATVIEIDGHRVGVTHPSRIIWPSSGTTKRDLVDYLVGVAPVMLPYLRGRATMLWRFPEGVDGPGWFQAQCRGAPAWMETFEIVSRRGEPLRYCQIDEPAALVWLANLGTIELHPHGWTVDRPGDATMVVFDLDPGPPAGLRAAASVAKRIAVRLRDVGLDPVVKTSGSLGLHVAAPLVEGQSFTAAKTFSRRIADELAAESPDAVIASNDRAARSGRVYVDWIQNDPRRQLVAPYSPRATPWPRVSLPLAWDEVGVLADDDVAAVEDLLGFAAVLARTARIGDRWTLSARSGSLPTATP
jgi:bifunctional non-homologous end joining protein LigD